MKRSNVTNVSAGASMQKSQKTMEAFSLKVQSTKMPASAPKTCEQHHYGICYNTYTGRFDTVKNPQHPNYPGYVYGTVRAHADADSAIGEYRECVQRQGIFENAEASAASDLR